MFEPGDKVICVDNAEVFFWLSQGKVYTVRKWDPHYKTVRLEGDVDGHEFMAFSAERFRLSEVMLLEDML